MTKFASKKYKILYEDSGCAVINKPAGVLVHNLPERVSDTTIAAWWLGQPDTEKNIWPVAGREGIVHRLDRDTTGALLLARNPEALNKLQKQFHDRTVKKYYLALVFGKPAKNEGEIESVISRQPKERTKRKASIIDFGGLSDAKKAITAYRLIGSVKYKESDISLIRFEIKTGRTHQVRLHAKMLGCPILGDRDYATKPSKRLSDKLGVERQMLHARELVFQSPENKRKVRVKAPLCDDMVRILAQLGLNN